VKALRAGRIDLPLLGNPCPEVEREFTVTQREKLLASSFEAGL